MTSRRTGEAIPAPRATTDLPAIGSISGLGRWGSHQMPHTGECEQANIHIIQADIRCPASVQPILTVHAPDDMPGAPGHRRQAEPGRGQPSGGESAPAARSRQ